MFIGGLDIGTTGCKMVIYDENGTLFRTYYQEYDAVHRNGQHEISFDDVKRGVFTLLKSVAHDFLLTAIGVTSFGEAFAMLDENDNVLAPSVYRSARRRGMLSAL